ncbi:hypothetical protein FSP39_007099 [Pinctada imbricata]|uniref:Nucleoporin NDC1 n=1 Tax=Pinctada imbricata TaxID=66713 RepID=A0AA88XQB5_PINIB|nr:hypothetical protein FSP39_007099 [Pinctada imbricata]
MINPSYTFDVYQEGSPTLKIAQYVHVSAAPPPGGIESTFTFNIRTETTKRCEGHIPRDCIADVIGLQRSEVMMNSLYGLLDIGLLWQTILCGFLIHFILSFASMLYRIYNTQHYAFTIESNFDRQKNHCLIDALQCHTNHLIKYLGYLDLCHLSKYSPERRQQMFTLSQPGGHPHNWNKICGACLKELNSLNEKLEDFNWKVFTSVPVRTQAAEKNNIAPMSGDQSASTLTYRGTMTNGIQRDTQQQPTNKVTESSSSNLVQFLKKKPVFSTLLSELPDSKSRQLFADVQIHIWACEALSNLAAASYVEDKYGVVQRSLPDIINTIISLHDNVEKHFKLASTGVRRHQKDTGALDVPLKYLLQTTLKASVYQMIQVFGKHILNLPISSDTLKKVKQFVDYRE